VKLQEKFKLTYTYNTPAKIIQFFDVNHFEQRMVQRGWKKHKVSRERIIDALRRGSDVIEKDWAFADDDYMIISPSLGIKIPVTVTKDRYQDRTIGLIPTLLEVESKYPQRSYYKNILIESRKRLIAVHLVENSDNFIDFYEYGEKIPSYETIFV